MFSANVFWTFVSKSLSAAVSLAIVIMGARNLGAEVMGEVARIILFVTIVQLLSGWLGGAALVYMAPRKPLLALFIPSYIFSIISSLLIAGMIYAAGYIQAEDLPELFALGTLISFSFINLYLLLGHEKIRWHNFLTLLQSLVHLGLMSYMVFVMQEKNVMSYIWGYVVSYGIIWIISLFLLPYSSGGFRFSSIGSAVADTFVYGFLVQLSSVFQFFNYRYSYAILIHEIKSLGIFSVAMQIAEGVWIISRSISMVQFARISNSQDTAAHLRQTLFLIKISAAGTIAGLSFFLFCPAQFFAWLFGADFYPARQLILYLSPGILLVAITSIISSYFSGSGKIWINTIGSFTGLVLAVIITAPLVHSHQLPGAALSNTLVYTGAFLVSLVAFVIIGKLKPVDFLPGKEDGEKLRLLYQRLSGKT